MGLIRIGASLASRMTKSRRLTRSPHRRGRAASGPPHLAGLGSGHATAEPPSSVTNSGGSFDHLVGAQEQRRGQLNADRLRGLEIDHQLVFDRLLDR